MTYHILNSYEILKNNKKNEIAISFVLPENFPQNNNYISHFLNNALFFDIQNKSDKIVLNWSNSFLYKELLKVKYIHLIELDSLGNILNYCVSVQREKGNK